MHNGYLLSGGLDSSLVCAIGQKLSDKPIRTFAIGMESDPIDLKLMLNKLLIIRNRTYRS